MEIKEGMPFYKDDIYKHYVIKVIEEEKDTIVVSKYFGRYKQWWHYQVESLDSFNHCFEIGLYSLKRRK